LRQAVFNRGLPIAERCRLGAAYIERGGNGEAAIEHEINLELLEKKKRKESAEALAAGRVNL
jgi:hypothetical protein